MDFRGIFNHIQGELNESASYNLKCPDCGTIFEVEQQKVGKPPFDTECPDCGKEVGSEHIQESNEINEVFSVDRIANSINSRMESGRLKDDVKSIKDYLKSRYKGITPTIIAAVIDRIDEIGGPIYDEPSNESTTNRSPERRSKILEHKKYSPLIFKLTRERKELSRKLKVCEKTKDPNRKEYLTRRVNEIDYKLKRLNKKVGINEVEVSGSIWGAHPKARGRQESYIIPKEVMDDYLDKNETAVTDYLMKHGIDIKGIKVMSGAAGTGVAYPVAEKKVNELAKLKDVWTVTFAEELNTGFDKDSESFDNQSEAEKAFAARLKDFRKWCAETEDGSYLELTHNGKLVKGYENDLDGKIRLSEAKVNEEMDVYELGPTPTGEECVQVNSKTDYVEPMKAECQKYKELLQKKFPIPEDVNAYFTIKRSDHEFGPYYEVAIKYDMDDPKANAFMLHVEGNQPESWADDKIVPFVYTPEPEMDEKINEAKIKTARQAIRALASMDRKVEKVPANAKYVVTDPDGDISFTSEQGLISDANAIPNANESKINEEKKVFKEGDEWVCSECSKRFDFKDEALACYTKCRKEFKKQLNKNESKVNEEEGLMAGGATQANDGDRAQDPKYGAPDPVAKPEPVVEPKPEEKNVEELPLEGEKEYLGNKGGEEYYYFVIVPAEDGTKDLQIQDANDEVVFSAKENQIDPSNNEDFLWKGIQELELSNVATEIVDKYLIPQEKPEDIEKEEGQAETGREQEQPSTEEPKESGVIPELGAPAFKTTVEAKKGSSKKMTTIKELKMRRLLCKYELNEDFADNMKLGDFIDPLGTVSEITPAHVKFQDAQGRLTGILLRASANAPVPPELQKRYGKDTGKFYNVDVDKMYKTGDVGETKMLERLMEKFGLKETTIDLLIEKYGLNEIEGEDVSRAPKNVEDLEKATGEKPQTADVLPDAAVGPEPGMATPGAVEEPAPLGAEPKAEEMLSSESAEADLKMKYPEEPYTTTAMAYADSLIDEPKVYGAVRNLKWQGVYANAETFLKQAKIVGNYNEFNPDIAKRLVDAVGEGAKYRLAREGSVCVYFTIRDLDKKISLETLKDLVRADEADPTGNDGEARLWWD